MGIPTARPRSDPPDRCDSTAERSARAALHRHSAAARHAHPHELGKYY